MASPEMTKKGRGKAAKNKTMAEVYGGGSERSSKKSVAPKKKMSSGERFIKHFTN